MLHFIVNPGAKSGKGKAIWKELEAVLKDRGADYDVVYTERDFEHSVRNLAHGIEAACAASGEPCTICLLGGDGSLNDMMQGIEHPENVTLGYIPGGSSNDFARATKIPNDPKAALERILQGDNIKEFDVGEMTYLAYDETTRKCSEEAFLTTRRFIVSCGIGFDADICEKAMESKMKNFLNRIHLGSLTYVSIALNLLAHMKKVGADFSVNDRPARHVDQLICAVGMNSKYQGGGYMFCPDADPSDRKLDVCVVQDLTVPKIIGILSALKNGQHTDTKGVSIFRGDTFHITTAEPMWVHTDGEVTVKATEIAVSVNKYRIKIYM